jgi:hypothetical protein
MVAVDEDQIEIGAELPEVERSRIVFDKSHIRDVTSEESLAGDGGLGIPAIPHFLGGKSDRNAFGPDGSYVCQTFAPPRANFQVVTGGPSSGEALEQRDIGGQRKLYGEIVSSNSGKRSSRSICGKPGGLLK